MELSTAQHQLHSNFPHQESQSLDSMITNSQSPAPENNQQPDQKKPRPPENEPQKCPRCPSTNTKFCYYNNYSLSQPRYFCKSCRRYWTKGGTLRNVPIGGGCRKSSKRSSSSSNSPSHSLKRAHTQDYIMTTSTASVPNPVFAGISNPRHAYGGGMGFEPLMGNANLTNFDGGVNFLGHHQSYDGGMSFLQELQYGNGGGLMFQSNYEENGAGNSNCVSGISDDVAAIAPYDDVTAVKQERGENEAFWGLPWQNSMKGDLDPERENWYGLIDNSSAWGLLNAPTLM